MGEDAGNKEWRLISKCGEGGGAKCVVHYRLLIWRDMYACPLSAADMHPCILLDILISAGGIHAYHKIRQGGSWHGC